MKTKHICFRGFKTNSLIRNLLFLFLLFISLAGLSQNFSDSLLYYYGSQVTYKNGTTLKNSQLIEVMKTCPEALVYMKKAKSRKDGETVFLVLGTVTLVPALYLGLEMKLSNNYNNKSKNTIFYALAGAGIGLDVIGLIVGSGYKKNKLKAVEEYNKCKQGIKSTTAAKIKIGTINGGLGMAFQF